MDRRIMEAMIESLNTSAEDPQIVAEYYYLDTDVRIIDIDGKNFSIVDGKVTDGDGIIYHTREQILGHKHVCPICGESEAAKTLATPVISVSIDATGIIIDDSLSGYDYGISANTTLFCPYCNAEMISFDKIDNSVCTGGIIYHYCIPPTMEDIIASLNDYLWECMRYGEEEMDMPIEDAAMQYIHNKYSGFIRLYGIEDEDILAKIEEGAEKWYAANAVRF